MNVHEMSIEDQNYDSHTRHISILGFYDQYIVSRKVKKTSSIATHFTSLSPPILSCRRT